MLVELKRVAFFKHWIMFAFKILSRILQTIEVKQIGLHFATSFLFPLFCDDPEVVLQMRLS